MPGDASSHTSAHPTPATTASHDAAVSIFAKSTAVFSALSVPAYRRYLLSFLCSTFAFQSQQTVRGWLAYELTGEAFGIGAVLLASGIAEVTGSLIGGVIADRVDRKRMMIASQSAVLAASLIIGVLVIYDAIEMWHLYASAAVTGLAMALHMPSRQAYIHDIVGLRHLANAISVNAAINNSQRLVAPAVTGVAIQFLGVGSAYFVTVGAYVLSIAALLVIVTGQPAQRLVQARQSPLKDFGQGFGYLLRNRVLFWLVLLGLGTAAIGLPYRDLMPAFARRALDQEAAGFGLLLSMAGVGSTVGTVVIAAAAGSRNKGRVMMITGVAWGAFVSVLALMPTMGAAIPVVIMLGGLSTIFNTMMNIVIQTNVDDAYRGRMLSFYMLTFAVHPMVTPVIGELADRYGIREALFGAGLVLLGFSLVMAIARRDLRHLS